MSTLDDLQRALQQQPDKPPIERWHPPLSGDIDIRIDKRGDWYHEGGRIERLPLVKLFASILRREDDGDYYLVTPVEKWRIKVEATPLIAIDMDVITAPEPQIIFRLNTDELVVLNDAHPLVVAGKYPDDFPHIMLDRGLSARLTTAVFYRLVDVAQSRGSEAIVQSAGREFAIGRIDR